MKLLAISTSSFTATNREFYRRLALENIEVHLVIPAFWNFGKGWIKADEQLPTDPEISFLRASNSHQRLYYLKNIRTIIHKFAPDTIYYEGDPGSLMAATLGQIAKNDKIKLFALSCENLSQSPIAVVKREGIKQLFHASIKYALIRLSMKKIHTLFVINDDGLEYFQAIGFKNVVKTPLGFNEQFFHINETWRTSIRKKLKIDDNTVVISYFGRLVYEKGVHLLIQALEQLQVDNWVFLIDDFGRYKNDYQEKIQKQLIASTLQNRIIFFEAEHGEIAQYMNASDIAVLPSIPTKKWVEQYGRVVPEAMACGNRIIVSNVGAQASFFEASYAYKYSPTDTNKLLALLEKAMEEISCKQFNRKEYAAIAANNFSLNAQIKTFQNTLKEL